MKIHVYLSIQVDKIEFASHITYLQQLYSLLYSGTPSFSVIEFKILLLNDPYVNAKANS